MVSCVRLDGSIKQFRIAKMFGYIGLKRIEINEAEAELILNSAVNISVYYLRVDGRKEKNSVNITKTS